jgi:hypothetical protein
VPQLFLLVTEVRFDAEISDEEIVRRKNAEMSIGAADTSPQQG